MIRSQYTRAARPKERASGLTLGIERLGAWDAVCLWARMRSRAPRAPINVQVPIWRTASRRPSIADRRGSARRYEGGALAQGLVALDRLRFGTTAEPPTGPCAWRLRSPRGCACGSAEFQFSRYERLRLNREAFCGGVAALAGALRTKMKGRFPCGNGGGWASHRRGRPATDGRSSIIAVWFGSR